MAFLKFGRRPPKNAPALRLAPLLTGVVPAHPLRADNLAKLSGWRMLGNDAFGDCVAVTWANIRRLTTAALATEFYPSIEQVYALYRTQNPGFIPNPISPGQDDGMDIQTCLEYLVKVGGPDGVKALAFAKVDAKNLQQLDAAMALFGAVWTGITVLTANEDEFDAGKPWDDVPGSVVAGGHSVMGAGYASDEPLDDIRFVTWGKETSFTDAFVRHEFDEAWVVVWPEHLGSKAFLEGVDLAQLAADFTALTGRAFPTVTPTPAPTPTPITPTPVDADHALADAVRAWSLARHSGANRLAARAVQTWLKAKGL